MHVKMSVITKISSYFERSVVTLKLRKEYLNTVIYNNQHLGTTTDKILSSLVYRTLFYVNAYGSFKLSTNSPLFWPILYIHCVSKMFLHLNSL